MSNEYNNKRYYWIKLKDTFFTSDTVDFLMSQKDGANYVVLYQMLCLKTANTNGELSRQIGEIIVPFDIDKIHRDCKYFSVDTIRVALELYKKLGLIYEQENGILQITNFANLIGSESQNAIYKRQQREEGKRLESVQQMSNKRLDIREKRKEIRDIEGDSLLIISLKDRFKRAGVYTGAFDEVIDEVLTVLGEATLLPRPLKFSGVTYTGEDFRRIADTLTVDDLCRIVNTLIGHKDEIEDARYYILGVIANIAGERR